jgi:hypothetical protein
MRRTHGIAIAGGSGESAVHFGIALWPYDLLLRFGYDLPENEHLWAGKWFDDRFEQAALNLRADAAKLIRALRRMDESLRVLATVAGEMAAADLPALKKTVERTPLDLDLVLSYLRRILDQLAAVVPCSFGREGQALLHARAGLRELAASPELARLDPELAALLNQAVDLEIPTHPHDLYVIAENGGYTSALPKAAVRALRASAAATLGAGDQIARAMRGLCEWLDAVLDHLQRVVAARSEPGPELLERWAQANWSVLLTLPAREPGLEALLPGISSI